MENENEDVDFENNEPELEEVEQDKPEDKSEDKPKETPEARLARMERQTAQLRKKLGVEPKEEKTESKSNKSEDFDYAQKAYLVANGIKGKKELELAQEFIKNTGKDLDDVIESKFFQSELKELRDADASANAVPKGSKRSTSSTKDSVDYWLAKDELPENTPENAELRRQIVNARYKRETAGSKFASSTTGSVMRQSQIKR